jgi:hypothetical protein
MCKTPGIVGLYIRISTRKQKQIEYESSDSKIRKLYSIVCAGGQAEVEERGRGRLKVWRSAQLRNRIVEITAPRLYCNIFSIVPHGTLYNFFTVSMLKSRKLHF